MSEPNGVRDILQQAGFRDAQLTGLEQPMHFGATAEDAYRFVLGLLVDAASAGRTRTTARPGRAAGQRASA
jgi:hypothetical protein